MTMPTTPRATMHMNRCGRSICKVAVHLAIAVVHGADKTTLFAGALLLTALVLALEVAIQVAEVIGTPFLTIAVAEAAAIARSAIGAEVIAGILVAAGTAVAIAEFLLPALAGGLTLL